MNTTTLIIYVVFFGALMYFMIFLPQRKRDKKAKELMSALQVGNMIVSIGGISGKVINLKDDEVTVETSVEKTQVVFKKWAIKEVQKPVEG
jgi:preprotein translocase subunit YajC